MSIVMTDTCTNVSRRVAPSPPIEGNTELRKGGQWPTQKLRAVLSDFGSRISFGFRVSDLRAAAPPRRRPSPMEQRET